MTPNEKATSKILRMSNAQTAAEVAIFGAIIIFILGTIIRYAVNFNYVQNQSLAAMRLALGQSFSASLITQSPTRNVATILFVEDRVDPTNASAQDLLEKTRTPYIVSSSGAFSRNLFVAADWDHQDELPVMDMYINRQHFTFTLAVFKRVDIHSVNILYTKLTNNDRRFCPTHSVCLAGEEDQRFDLDRNGTPDAIGNRSEFSWQWMAVPTTTKYINFKDGGIVSLDVDGDLKEEQVVGIETKDGRSILPDTKDETPILSGGSLLEASNGAPIAHLLVIDSQDGDLDLTYNTRDARGLPTPQASGGRTPPPRPGLREDSQIFSSSQGSTFRIESGKLYNGKQYVRDTTRRDHVDVISRSVQLSNDTWRFCDKDNKPVAGSNVEVCASGAGDCFSDDKIQRTCFDKSNHNNILYVRSRIAETRGRKWITDTSSDTSPIR